MKSIAAKAVEIMKFKKVDFGDIRIIEERVQSISVKNMEISELKDDTTLGFGVRVLYNGGWGFASSNIMNMSEVEKVVNLAIDIAKSSSEHINKKVKLAFEPSYQDIWRTPYLKDPFSVPIEKKLEILFKVNEILLKGGKIKIANSKMDFVKTHKRYASTEGSDIEQILVYSGAGYNAVAIGQEVQTRSYPGGTLICFPWVMNI